MQMKFCSAVNATKDERHFQININAAVNTGETYISVKLLFLTEASGRSWICSWWHPPKCVQETRYLGVKIQTQSNLEFENHITFKISSALRVLGCIKYSVHEAPEKCKLLAYTDLCWPILEYGNTLWNPYDNTTSGAIKFVQSQTMRLIKNVKGRHGVTEARIELRPKTLRQKKNKPAVLADENILRQN